MVIDKAILDNLIEQARGLELRKYGFKELRIWL